MVLLCLQIHRTVGRHYFRYAFSTLKFNYSTKNSASNTIPVLWDCRKSDPTIKEADVVAVQLLSWGRGSSGQLGGGIEEIRMYPVAVASLLLPSSFTLSSPLPGHLPLSKSVIKDEAKSVKIGISSGLFHSALLVDGKVWIWGKGDGGRLGLGHEDSVFIPTLNTHLTSNWIQSIALGGLHSVALNSLGQIFTWGYGGFGALGHSVYHRELIPRLVEGPWNKEICSIATSGAHTAAITTSGELYTWGRDEGDGRLGLGTGRGPNEAGGLSTPTKVKALPVSVAAVSCGGFFTMALSDEGQVWNWGANSNYELGRGDKLGGWKPQPIPSLKDACIIQIASGGFHSIALTAKGEVLSWGHGGHGQLGHSSTENQKVPTRIEALTNERVIYIACGGSSSAALTVQMHSESSKRLLWHCIDEGKLYMWGNAKDCQLGISGLPEVQASPVEVKFVTQDDGSMIDKVLSVSIGASHAMCLVTCSGC